MANNATFLVLRGKVHWAKIVGAAKPHTGQAKYDKGPKWSVDLTPNDASREKIKIAGIEDKLKKDKPGSKYPRSESFLSLTMLENRSDGKKNKPPVIKDASGRDWGEDVEIGNESVMDIEVKVVDYGDTVGVYYQKGRVLQHVPYEGGGSGDFEPLSEDDEFFGADATPTTSEAKPKTSPNPDDLDDDVPF